jgi:uncharacterized protein YndB with AHSA1/START domain
MKILLLVVASLAVLVALSGLIGSRLARNHRAVSRIRLSLPPEAVWPTVRDLEAVGGWWPEVKRSERLTDQAGLQRYQHTLDDFAMILLVTEDQPPHLLRTTIDSPPGAPFGGAWIYELTPSGSGTVLTVTEEGWIDNPFFRVAARAMGYHRTLDGYLAALAKHLGATAPPEHLP